jgi:prepilin-type N-terminal cleavage/methylation domain-containing protein
MKITSHNKGFTLIETLVALAIFTISIVGLVAVTAGGINNVTYAKNKITAMALSAEGVELIRSVRDNFALQSTTATGWTDFTSELANKGCTTGSGCIIDAETLTLVGCLSSGCPFMNKYTSANADYYGYKVGTQSSFARTILISGVSTDEISITSTVSWVQGDGIRSVSTQENLLNWFALPAPVTP